VAGDEDESQKIVAEILIDRCLETGAGDFLTFLDLAAEDFVFLLDALGATQLIDGPTLRQS